MLNITRLLSPGKRGIRLVKDPGRYRFSGRKKPVVVWNVTYRCNLLCQHCYSASRDGEYRGELTFQEGLDLIKDLADYGVPAIVVSGGEPLLREDIFPLIETAAKKGVSVALSSNGTMITREKALRLKDSGCYYVGVSIDGTREVNDAFRGREGAFEEAIRGLREAKKAGLKVGLRFTITKRTIESLPYLFDLAVDEGVDRLYLSHLVYVGRGRKLSAEALGPEGIRRAVDYIFDRTEDMLKKGIDLEVVTGNNDVDGVYLYLNLLKKDPERAREVYRLLERRGGNSTGVAIACVDSFGRVHPDQYWTTYTIGSIRERPFSELWEGDDPLLKALRNRKACLRGRCSWCSFVDLCMGNYRERAEVFSGDLWGDDPACYLMDEEIGGKDTGEVRISAG